MPRSHDDERDIAARRPPTAPEEIPMASRVRIERSGERVALIAPEHPQLGEKAAELGGRRQRDGWVFPARDEARVRKLARHLYGTDGTDRSTATMRVDLSLYGEGSLGHEGEAWLAGRLLARRPSFDQPVELGDGVRLVRGGFGVWGGSRNHPALDAEFATVVDVSDVPASAAEVAAERYPIAVAVVDKDGEAQVGIWSKVVTTREAAERDGQQTRPQSVRRRHVEEEVEERPRKASQSGGGTQASRRREESAPPQASTPAPKPKAKAKATAAPAPSAPARRDDRAGAQRSAAPAAAAPKQSAKKQSAKKQSAKKASANKAAPKKSAPKKTSPKKSAPKKTSAKKTASKKASSKKASSKKTSARRAPARPARKKVAARATARPAPKRGGKKKTTRSAPKRGGRKATRRGRR
jgi:hypothetical protein